LVISTLKASSLAALASGIAPLLGAHTAVVFAQNGIPWWYLNGLPPQSPTRRFSSDLSFLDRGGILSRAVEGKRIIGAIVNTANTVIAPGVINNSSPKQNRLHIGEPNDAPTDRVAALRAMFIAAGVESPAVKDIRQELWQKLLSNLVTGTAVLVEQATNDMLANPQMAELAKRLVDEGVAIGRAHGMALQPIMPSVPAGKKSSILQDYESGRRMEVDAQFRAPLAFAQAAKVDAPVLESVAALIGHKAAAKGLYQRA
jgi:2-dehydropantoate 2-reductase